ncbi:hypothetical protein B7494_g2899 [Chlorociboria aeruginascens]|nr:hypothetical protein B7494_g2899 [Chlorociboria aeruginascens]
MPPQSHPLLTTWAATHASFPNLPPSLSTPVSLITTSIPTTFKLGTGAQVLSSSFTPASIPPPTTRELILVTCFWTSSPSLNTLNQLLVRLSTLACSQSRTITIRICISSVSLFQKAFHTASPAGYIYPSSSWASLGLPRPEEIAGLDMVVKSVFIRPFSVMHSKFLIVDRETVLLPSANVSWEQWFEGGMEMRGPIVDTFLQYWVSFWGVDEAAIPDSLVSLSGAENLQSRITSPAEGPEVVKGDLLFQQDFPPREIPTILLPSPHTSNPHFRPFCLAAPEPPKTPLNTFLLTAFSTATKSVYMQTPNLTSPPILAAILEVLKRGVHVKIVTNERLMVLEQCVTAGTTTAICIRHLVKTYHSLLPAHTHSQAPDLEALQPKMGVLKIAYYEPLTYEPGEGAHEPLKSHLKVTVFDGEVVVLGSGNLDRASWYTSQEVGVAFLDSEVAGWVMGGVKAVVGGRVRWICR